MQPYPGANRNSGIVAYEAGEDFMRIRFARGGTYLYTYRSTGAEHVEAMKFLARRGDGLNTFINQYVRDAYARRES